MPVFALLAASTLLASAPAHRAARAQAFTPTLAVSPVRIPRGGFLTLAGTGWPQGGRVRLAIETPDAGQATVGRVLATAQGRFVLRVRVGLRAPLGAQTAVGCARACRLTARAPFRVVRAGA